MGKWSMASRSHADYMRGGDFSPANSPSPWPRPVTCASELVGKDGKVEVKKQLSLQEGEVLDSMFARAAASCATSSRRPCRTAKTGVMWSLHVKATMMKISHPIVFGHCGERLLQGRLRQVGPTLRRVSA
ncbi:NADP-dependent isocitrate dehydrogenase [Pseudomonas aeruginosa]|nr:NADP-dependent isocitrate dehydrogenase [Pseudomonas aeruginosa]